MSPTDETKPAKPTTAYATSDQTNADPIVEETDALLAAIDELLDEETDAR